MIEILDVSKYEIYKAKSGPFLLFFFDQKDGILENIENIALIRKIQLLEKSYKDVPLLAFKFNDFIKYYSEEINSCLDILIIQNSQNNILYEKPEVENIYQILDVVRKKRLDLKKLRNKKFRDNAMKFSMEIWTANGHNKKLNLFYNCDIERIRRQNTLMGIKTDTCEKSICVNKKCLQKIKKIKEKINLYSDNQKFLFKKFSINKPCSNNKQILYKIKKGIIKYLDDISDCDFEKNLNHFINAHTHPQNLIYPISPFKQSIIDKNSNLIKSNSVLIKKINYKYDFKGDINLKIEYKPSRENYSKTISRIDKQKIDINNKILTNEIDIKYQKICELNHNYFTLFNYQPNHPKSNKVIMNIILVFTCNTEKSFTERKIRYFEQH